MNTTKNGKLTHYAKKLRKNMTKEERHLWYDYLKPLPITIHRQKVIGEYIADFYCAAAKTIIELDGSQHFETAGRNADDARDNYFRKLGITVLRYSNRDVNQRFDAVCEDIYLHIASAIAANTSSTASGPPSPQGEG